ncbi:ATP phosphoribosyltransferase regulatory subunit [Acuticoccus sediminis]|uniref:ATP phosphoribosyltransferase regulatory subunit n=1 Tax=Acuticoccus sediminis TaxID=2184697 RepID=A0A8B2P1V8_9HYPH|nr:ATP phosphoribosyltransferase regulatory subunit [Acuticoccus sediminis]RAI03944.1 ATP phosphoribosyltransferase regulatory subunit [Acuticoccus sediminis]
MSQAVWSVLEAASEMVVSVPLLQPADIFVDLAGEEFRKRLFTTDDGAQTLCLRPDFTIPVCYEHLAAHRDAPKTYAYAGKIFRKRRMSGDPEFTQMGTEWIGHGDEMATDARVFALAMECAAAAGMRAPQVRVGDAHVFDALTAALGLSASWRSRLNAAFGDTARMAGALSRLARRDTSDGLAARLGPALAKVDAAQARAIVEAVIGLPGAPPPGGRTDEDIAMRLLEQASNGGSVRAAETIERFLPLTAPLDRASERLTAFARAEGLDLGPVIEDFQRRTDALGAIGVDTSALTFDASFGRRIGYYTGFVFEMLGIDGVNEAIAGGRYDKLIALLDPTTSLPGIGFSVWLDRLPEATS